MNPCFRFRIQGLLLGLITSAALHAHGQRVAVLTPDQPVSSGVFAAEFSDHLEERINIIDSDIVAAAASSALPITPYNMTSGESKRLAAAIGCDFFVLIRSGTLRRSSSSRTEYYESYAALYAVSGRTGSLVHWSLPRFEADGPQEAELMLKRSIPRLTTALVGAIKASEKIEIAEPAESAMEEPPAENSPESKAIKPPVPYRRIKPEYTVDAAMFDVGATVDVMIDLAESGSILRTRIVRWAGFGLDEAVIKAVTSMNWRPAMRDGRPIAMRFLVRYNFKKIEK